MAYLKIQKQNHQLSPVYTNHIVELINLLNQVYLIEKNLKFLDIFWQFALVFFLYQE